MKRNFVDRREHIVNEHLKSDTTRYIIPGYTRSDMISISLYGFNNLRAWYFRFPNLKQILPTLKNGFVNCHIRS